MIIQVAVGSSHTLRDWSTAVNWKFEGRLAVVNWVGFGLSAPFQDPSSLLADLPEVKTHRAHP